jgi:arsenate reductase
MDTKRVLFICSHNSARSQMAETFLNDLGRERFAAESAGLEPGTINPLVVAVMREMGYDLSDKGTRAVFDLYKRGELYDHVITVCAEAEEKCPVFPGVAYRDHWPFPDPSALTGDEEAKLAKCRDIRDAIRKRVAEYVAEHS